MSNKLITKNTFIKNINNNIIRNDNNNINYVYYDCYNKNIFTLDTSLIDDYKCLTKEEINNTFQFSTNDNSTTNNKLISEKNINFLNKYTELFHIKSFTFEHPGNDIDTIKANSFSLGINKGMNNVSYNYYPYILDVKKPFNVYYEYKEAYTDGATGDELINSLFITGFYLNFLKIESKKTNNSFYYDVYYKVDKLNETLARKDYENIVCEDFRIYEIEDIEKYVGKIIKISLNYISGIKDGSTNNYNLLDAKNFLLDDNNFFPLYFININDIVLELVEDIEIKNNYLNKNYLNIYDKDVLYDVELIDKENNSILYSSYGNRGLFKFPINDIKAGEKEQYKITFYTSFFTNNQADFYNTINLEINTERIFNDINPDEPDGAFGLSEDSLLIETILRREEDDNISFIKDRYSYEPSIIEEFSDSINKYYTNNITIVNIPIWKFDIDEDNVPKENNKRFINYIYFKNYPKNVYYNNNTTRIDYKEFGGILSQPNICFEDGCYNECYQDCTIDCDAYCGIDFTPQCPTECKEECYMDCPYEEDIDCYEDIDGDLVEDDIDTCIGDYDGDNFCQNDIDGDYVDDSDWQCIEENHSY